MSYDLNEIIKTVAEKTELPVPHVDIDELDKSISGKLDDALMSIIGPDICNLICTEQNIPRVFATITHEMYDFDTNLTVYGNTYTFDCTVPLDVLISANINPNDFFPDIDLPKSEVELDPELCDNMFRLAADLGLAKPWQYSFECDIESGWDAYRTWKLTQIEKAKTNG